MLILDPVLKDFFLNWRWRVRSWFIHQGVPLLYCNHSQASPRYYDVHCLLVHTRVTRTLQSDCSLIRSACPCNSLAECDVSTTTCVCPHRLELSLFVLEAIREIRPTRPRRTIATMFALFWLKFHNSGTTVGEKCTTSNICPDLVG